MYPNVSKETLSAIGLAAAAGASVTALKDACMTDDVSSLQDFLPPFMINEKKGERPPSGSKPISDTPWSGDHQGIKQGVGAAPDDTVVIAPGTNDVWVQNPDGSWTNHGPASSYTGSGKASGRRGRDRDGHR